MRETLRGSNSLGETDLDTLRFDELEQAFAVSAHIAIDFGQSGKLFALRLGNIENIDGPESVQRPVTFGCCVITRFVGCCILRASSSDHRGENENPFFSPFNEAAKRVPCPKSGNIGSVGLLACYEHDVAEAVGVKLRHCSEVCGEDFTVTRLQCCNEEIDGLFGSFVDFFNNPAQQEVDIDRLRQLHMEMDRTVTRAYGWNDLDLGHGFQETSVGVRFTISELARRTVLDRLLALNHRRC